MHDVIDKFICACGARKVDVVYDPQLRMPQYRRNHATFCPHCDRVTNPASPARGTCGQCDRLHKHTR